MRALPAFQRVPVRLEVDVLTDRGALENDCKYDSESTCNIDDRHDGSCDSEGLRRENAKLRVSVWAKVTGGQLTYRAKIEALTRVMTRM